MTDTQPKTPAPAEPVEQAQGYDVFISYSRADRDRVVELVEGLEARGVRAWVDLEAIPPSAEWMGEIRAAIDGADGYLVVLSPDLARSQVCAEELEHAVGVGKRIVPVLVRATDPGSLPPSLAARNWIDATGRLEDALDQIVSALRTDLDHVKAHTRLGVLAGEWERKGEPKALLLRGAEIAQAEQVVASAAEPRATPTQARFVQASRAGATRRQRGLIGAAAGALVVAVALSAVALVQRGEAVEQRDVAERRTQVANSRALAAEALLSMDERLDVGMLLALEAYDAAPTAQALDALHVAAQRSAWIEQTFRDHDEGVNAVAMAPSGEVLAEAGSDGLVVLRDPASGELLREPLKADEESVYAVAIDTRSRWLATGGQDGTVIVWDLLTDEKLHTFEVDGASVSALTFADDDSVVVAGTGNGTIERWSLRSEKRIGGPIRISEGVGPGGSSVPARTVTSLSTDPASGDVWAGTQKGEVIHLNVRTGKELGRLSVPAEQVWSLATSSDGSLLAVGTLARSTQAATGDAFVLDTKNGRQVWRLQGHEDAVYSVSFSPDDEMLATASADGSVRTWSMIKGEPVGEPFRAHRDWVNGLAYTPDGRSLFSGSSDGTVIRWDVGRRLFGLGGAVNQVAISPDGLTMVSTEPIVYGPDGGVTPGGVLLWDVGTLESIATKEDSGAYGIAFTDDGERIVGTDIDTRTVTGRVVVLDAATLGVEEAPDGPEDFLAGIDVSGEDTIVAGGGTGSVYLYEDGGSTATSIPGQEGLVYAVRFSPDGLMLATGSFDGSVVLRDPVTGAVDGDPLLVDQGSIYALAFDPPGERLAVGDFQGRVTVWDTTSRAMLLNLELDEGALGVAFDPSGTVLAVGTTSGATELFDALTGEQIGEPLPFQRDWVNSVAFSPDGRLLATASEDGSILMLDSVLWSNDIELLTDRLCRAAGRDLTPEERGSFGLETDDPTCGG